MRQRRWSRKLALLVAVGALVPTQVSAGEAGSGTDPLEAITGSAAGKAAVARATTLLDDVGFRVDAGRLRAYANAGGDILVVPESVLETPALNARRDPHLEWQVGTTIEADPLEGLSASVDTRVAAAAYWSQRESGCFAWLRRNESYSAPCYYIHKLINDGDWGRDYWSLKYKTTIGAEGASANWDGWISSVRTPGSTTQTWFDWDPGGDVRSNCQDVTLGVQVRLATASISATRCERWDMTLSSTPGTFRNHWNCDCFIPTDEERQVAFVIGVTTAQNRSPLWNLAHGFRGG